MSEWCQNGAFVNAKGQHGPHTKLCMCVNLFGWMSKGSQSVFGKCQTLPSLGTYIEWGSNQMKVTVKCILHVFNYKIHSKLYRLGINYRINEL